MLFKKINKNQYKKKRDKDQNESFLSNEFKKKEIVKLGCSCYLFHGHLEAFIFLTAGSVRQCRPKLPQKGFITVIVGLIVAKFVCDDHDDY